jgi:hypothetical protein
MSTAAIERNTYIIRTLWIILLKKTKGLISIDFSIIELIVDIVDKVISKPSDGTPYSFLPAGDSLNISTPEVLLTTGGVEKALTKRRKISDHA